MPRELETDILRWIDDTRRTFNIGLFCHYLTKVLVPCLYIAATLTLAIKVSGAAARVPPAFPFIVLGPALIAIVGLTFSRRYSRTDIAAWLDLKSRAGGTLLQWSEDPTGASTALSAPVPNARRARPVYRFGALIKPLFLPLLFVIASAIVPSSPNDGAHSAAAVHRQARETASRIEEVRNLQVLEEETLNNLEQHIESLQQDADRSPEAAMEALDQVQHQLEESLIGQASKHRRAMEAAEKLAESISRESSRDASGGKKTAVLDDAGLTSALSDALKGAPPMPNLPESLQKAMQDFMKKAGLNASSLSNLTSKALSQMSSQQLEELSKLVSQAHGSQLSEMMKALDAMTSASAKEMLAGMTGKASSALENIEFLPLNAAKLGQDGIGRGGISRGRGDAPLILGDESESAGNRFKAVPFKPGSQFLPAVPLSSTRTTSSETAPLEFRAPTRTGASVPTADGGVQYDAQMAPFQRDVAARYFGEEVP